jgi:hypothetical protein
LVGLKLPLGQLQALFTIVSPPTHEQELMLVDNAGDVESAGQVLTFDPIQ